MRRSGKQRETLAKAVAAGSCGGSGRCVGRRRAGGDGSSQASGAASGCRVKLVMRFAQFSHQSTSLLPLAAAATTTWRQVRATRPLAPYVVVHEPRLSCTHLLMHGDGVRESASPRTALDVSRRAHARVRRPSYAEHGQPCMPTSCTHDQKPENAPRCF